MTVTNMDLVCLGAMIGDIAGSRFEFDNIKSKDFQLFHHDCTFTDDTVLTCATARAITDFATGPATDFMKKEDPGKPIDVKGPVDVKGPEDVKRLEDLFQMNYRAYGREYPGRGYGGNFRYYLYDDDPKPYNSFGNGSAMRVSPVGWYAGTLEQAEELAAISARVTHNHPEGIKGAVATAASIFLARSGKSKEDIRDYIQSRHYSLDFTIDEIRPDYDFDETCQGSVPQAIMAFLESEGFEDTIRMAISIGGDSDTIAAIAGSIAEAFYGIPGEIKEKALEYLDRKIISDMRLFTDILQFSATER